MSLWAAYDFEIITKSLLYLLKNDFMMAKNYDDMRRVFLESPSKLLTADIQQAFMHLSSGRKENEVAFLNKRSTKAFSENTGYYTRAPNKDSLNSKKTNLDPIGLKEIKLSLVIPKLVYIKTK